MNVKTVTLAYYSPTKTTQKILQGIAEGMNAENVRHIDLTLRKHKQLRRMKRRAT